MYRNIHSVVIKFQNILLIVSGPLKLLIEKFSHLTRNHKKVGMSSRGISKYI